MEVILLERIEKLGQMGEVVTVKPGFARNYLLPQKKALRATRSNKETFEAQRAQLEAVNLERRSEAESVGSKLDGQSVIIVRQASDNDQLYGSVTVRNIAQAVTEAGFTVDSKQVQMARPIKTIGMHPVRVQLHPEVSVNVTVNVARSEEEAKMQAEGRTATDVDDDLDAEKPDYVEMAEEMAEQTEDPLKAEEEADDTDADSDTTSEEDTSGDAAAEDEKAS